MPKKPHKPAKKAPATVITVSFETFKVPIKGRIGVRALAKLSGHILAQRSALAVKNTPTAIKAAKTQLRTDVRKAAKARLAKIDDFAKFTKPIIGSSYGNELSKALKMVHSGLSPAVKEAALSLQEAIDKKIAEDIMAGQMPTQAMFAKQNLKMSMQTTSMKVPEPKSLGLDRKPVFAEIAKAEECIGILFVHPKANKSHIAQELVDYLKNYFGSGYEVDFQQHGVNVWIEVTADDSNAPTIEVWIMAVGTPKADLPVHTDEFIDPSCGLSNPEASEKMDSLVDAMHKASKQIYDSAVKGENYIVADPASEEAEQSKIMGMDFSKTEDAALKHALSGKQWNFLKAFGMSDKTLLAHPVAKQLVGEVIQKLLALDEMPADTTTADMATHAVECLNSIIVKLPTPSQIIQDLVTDCDIDAAPAHDGAAKVTAKLNIGPTLFKQIYEVESANIGLSEDWHTQIHEWFVANIYQLTSQWHLEGTLGGKIGPWHTLTKCYDAHMPVPPHDGKVTSIAKLVSTAQKKAQGVMLVLNALYPHGGVTKANLKKAHEIAAANDKATLGHSASATLSFMGKAKSLVQSMSSKFVGDESAMPEIIFVLTDAQKKPIIGASNIKLSYDPSGNYKTEFKADFTGAVAGVWMFVNGTQTVWISLNLPSPVCCGDTVNLSIAVPPMLQDSAAADAPVKDFDKPEPPAKPTSHMFVEFTPQLGATPSGPAVACLFSFGTPLESLTALSLHNGENALEFGPYNLHLSVTGVALIVGGKLIETRMFPGSPSKSYDVKIGSTLKVCVKLNAPSLFAHATETPPAGKPIPPTPEAIEVTSELQLRTALGVLTVVQHKRLSNQPLPKFYMLGDTSGVPDTYDPDAPMPSDQKMLVFELDDSTKNSPKPTYRQVKS